MWGSFRGHAGIILGVGRPRPHGRCRSSESSPYQRSLGRAPFLGHPSYSKIKNFVIIKSASSRSGFVQATMCFVSHMVCVARCLHCALVAKKFPEQLGCKGSLGVQGLGVSRLGVQRLRAGHVSKAPRAPPLGHPPSQNQGWL